MCLRLDVVGNEARPLLGRDLPRGGHRALMICVVGVEQRQDRARIPEYATSHSSRIACLSRAPGVLPPPRPAPTRRKIGWSSENAATWVERRRPVWVRNAVTGTRRRPARRTLGRSPRLISRQTVERETPSACPASSTVTNCAATPTSYHIRIIVSIVSGRFKRRSFVCPKRRILRTTQGRHELGDDCQYGGSLPRFS